MENIPLRCMYRMKNDDPMRKASCICIRIPNQLQICTFNKDNPWKLEANESDLSVVTAYVGNIIRSYLVISKMPIGQTAGMVTQHLKS